MTQEDIIRMAREAGLYTKCEVHSAVPFDQLLERFAVLVEEAATEAANARANTSWTLMCKKMVAAENEACAKVCESNQMNSWGCAQLIRARGQA